MLKDFLHDRLPLIVLIYFSTLITILIAVLLISFSGGEQSFSTYVYMLLLASLFLCAGLLIDYVRHRSFLKQLYAIDPHSTSLDEIRKLTHRQAPTQTTKRMLDVIRTVDVHTHDQIIQYETDRKQHETFINQWVHHMKTPMSVISLLSQEGKKQAGDDHVQTFFNDIQDENDRFRHGLELMLQLARLDHFSLDFRAEPVELTQLLREVINEEKRQFIRRNLYPQIVEDTDQTIVYSDSKWLRTVIKQLIINAINYSHHGDGNKITCKIKQERESVSLFIQDSGIGIPTHDLPRVFEPFFTGDNGRKKTESTGMGLYLARTIANQLGHSLTIDSELERGTTVRLTFTSKTL
ncbi:HAMP domain-containing sensor histidine kinase [Geomicrobium sp. JCM 19038]|uniref:sensor histidine kinase n=1 Tax=Geomicrobium sp. JCM 19038 TaxID=1460635 RepID=UPI0005A71458|nr:sensor histidine kinase [Geomicrobium sp. JCM 19038]